MPGRHNGDGRVSRPDEDGIRMVRGRYRANTSSVKLMAPAPERACSPQWRTVSVMAPSFISTVMPRLMPMIKATPKRSAQPAT